MKRYTRGFIVGLMLLAAMLAVFPGRAAAQTGTVTDDAFASSSSATQLLNLNGQGISLIVAGSSAEVGPVHVGTTTTYIKFQLQSSLPPSVAAANVAKATLKLYISPGISPSGEINIYPVTSAWSESTLSPSLAPTLASSAFAANIPVGKANSFLVVDVTQLVQDWLNGTENGGLNNDGIAIEAATSSSYVVFDSKEDIVTSHEPRLEIVLASAGAQGPPGPEGPQGPAGAPGATGPAGSVGPAGATGAAGAMGSQGPAGPTGATGTQGAQGIPGSMGSAGPQGPIGINNRGAWNGGVQYNANDAVTDSNSFWLALVANSASEPNASNSNWQLLAAGINNRGAWSASSSYNVSDAVTDAGSFWLALVPTSASSASPNTSCEPSQPACTAYWQLLAAGLSSLNGLSGLPCAMGTNTGAVALTFASTGAATMTCTLAQPTGVINLGTFNCGQFVTLNGTLVAGSSQWYQVNYTGFGDCSNATAELLLTTSSSIVFDLDSFPLSGPPIFSGVTHAFPTVAIEATFLIRVYGATPSATGSWTLTVGTT